MVGGTLPKYFVRRVIASRHAFVLDAIEPGEMPGLESVRQFAPQIPRWYQAPRVTFASVGESNSMRPGKRVKQSLA